jgi:chromosome segregation ATPase
MVYEALLWNQEQLHAALEQIRVQEKSIAVLRSEKKAAYDETLHAKMNALRRDEKEQDYISRIEDLTTKLTDLQRSFDELELNFYRERQEHAIREETIALYNAAHTRQSDIERLKKAFDEQRTLCDVIADRLATAERELDAAESERTRLREDLRSKDEQFRAVWAMLTPQQKGKYMNQEQSPSADKGAPESSPSIVQSYELQELRSQVRELQQRLKEEQLRGQRKDYWIEDLQRETEYVQEQLRLQHDELETLRRLEQRHDEQREQFEAQLADLYTCIDAHAERQRQLERRCKELQQEAEDAEDEYRAAQRTINELTIKLDRSIEELRSHEQGINQLSARLKEAEEEKMTIARMRAEDQARVSELERQLQLQQINQNEVSKRLDVLNTRKQHVIHEIRSHNSQTDYLRQKLVRMNPETAKKHLEQLMHVDYSRVMPATPAQSAAALAEQINRQTKASRYRYEVSQLMRVQKSLAPQRSESAPAVGIAAVQPESSLGTPVDKGAPPLPGVAPSALYRDPHTTGITSVPPPPPRLPVGRKVVVQGPNHAENEPLLLNVAASTPVALGKVRASVNGASVVAPLKAHKAKPTAVACGIQLAAGSPQPPQHVVGAEKRPEIPRLQIGRR